MDEILNIEYHKKRLVLIAITKYKRYDEAAQVLGITRRTIYNLIKKYNLL